MASVSESGTGVTHSVREDGCLLVLDILYKQDGPLLEFNAHDGALTSLTVHHTGSLLCLGKDDGTVALIELSDGLVFSPNTKVFESKKSYTDLQSSF